MSFLARRTCALSVVVAAGLLITACGDSQPTAVDGPATEQGAADEPGSPLRVGRGAALGEPQTPPAPGEVKLWVSNQSFEDESVRLTISIAGTQVVDETFAVEGQHDWIAFDIAGLEPGVQSIVAESETGARYAGEFTIPADAPRWLVVDYWYSPGDAAGRHFGFAAFEDAVAFA
jgi:hypothetical protein